jgi:hypothetical protein
MAAPHPVIAYTSEASWAMVSRCERLKPHEMLTSTSSKDRGQILALREGNVGESHPIPRGMSGQVTALRNAANI